MNYVDSVKYSDKYMYHVINNIDCFRPKIKFKIIFKMQRN